MGIKKIFILLMILSSTLFGLSVAQAACVKPGPFPPNDVSLDGFSFEFANAALPALEVDMNGIQRDLDDQLVWATHGTLVVFPASAAGNPMELIASWTKNSYRKTEEFVCRFKLEPGTGLAFGDGAVHTQDAGGAITSVMIPQCEMDLFTDC